MFRLLAVNERTDFRGVNDYKMKSRVNGVCEAQKCFAQATTMVRVSAGVINGRQIAIPLSLCNNCVGKFEIINENEGDEQGKGLAPVRSNPELQYAQHAHDNNSPKPSRRSYDDNG